MRERVLKALAKYFEGGTIRDAIDTSGLQTADFYGCLDANPDIEQRYRAIQKARADLMVDEAYGVTFSEPDPKVARMKADVRIKLAGLHDRARYGERVDLTLTQQVSIAAALADMRMRLGRDLTDVSDVQVIDAPAIEAPRATDKQSAAPTDDAPDIFDGA